MSAGWSPAAPDRPLDLYLRLDGLAALFVLLVLGIGLLVILYASQYLAEGERIGRFFGLLLLFMGAMLGVVLSDNLPAAARLLGDDLAEQFPHRLWHQRAEARRGAYMALTVTGGGGRRSWPASSCSATWPAPYPHLRSSSAGELIRGHDLYLSMLALILTGAFAKSAQFPSISGCRTPWRRPPR